MFERTAPVRDASRPSGGARGRRRAISEMLGYRAVVVNVYRPAFDDMHTSAAVGSEDSVRELVGKSLAARDLDAAAGRALRAGDGAYFVAGGEFDWDALGVETATCRASTRARTRMPGGPRTLCSCRYATQGHLIGVISVDEPESGGAPTTKSRRARDNLPPRGPRAADRAGHGPRHGAPADARGHPRGVGARGRGRRSRTGILQAVCDGIRTRSGSRPCDRAGRGPDVPLEPSRPAAGRSLARETA